jgi:hypothetical protein
MAYINGLRSFGHKSVAAAARSKTKKRPSIDEWMDALTKAEHAHLLCREAAELARSRRYEEAEQMAANGVDELRARLVFFFL